MKIQLHNDEGKVRLLILAENEAERHYLASIAAIPNVGAFPVLHSPGNPVGVGFHPEVPSILVPPNGGMN